MASDKTTVAEDDGEDGGGGSGLDISKLSDSEADALDWLLAKAGGEEVGAPPTIVGEATQEKPG